MTILFFSRAIDWMASATADSDIGDHVDAIDVYPFTDDLQPLFRLVLMVGDDDLDVDAGCRLLEILHRHFAATTEPGPE